MVDLTNDMTVTEFMDSITDLPYLTFTAASLTHVIGDSASQYLSDSKQCMQLIIRQYRTMLYSVVQGEVQ